MLSVNCSKLLLPTAGINMTLHAKPFTLADPVHPGDHFLGPHPPRLRSLSTGIFECPSCGLAYPAVKHVAQTI
jgi:hypothetical protein